MVETKNKSTWVFELVIRGYLTQYWAFIFLLIQPFLRIGQKMYKISFAFKIYWPLAEIALASSNDHVFNLARRQMPWYCAAAAVVAAAAALRQCKTGKCSHHFLQNVLVGNVRCFSQLLLLFLHRKANEFGYVTDDSWW